MAGEKKRGKRRKRDKESKLKITEAEKLYKERAVKGIVFDAADWIERESTFHTGKKGEGKKALDISYDMLEQMEVGICLLKESLKVLVEKGNCL